jgi:hypothetical protein
VQHTRADVVGPVILDFLARHVGATTAAAAAQAQPAATTARRCCSHGRCSVGRSAA